MDSQVLIAIALVVLGAGAFLNLAFLRINRGHVGAPMNRALMGGAATCYFVSAIVMCAAAFQS